MLPRPLTEELRNAVPGHGALDIRELRLPWPHTPFGKVAEVDEASGTEEELIEALRGPPGSWRRKWPAFCAANRSPTAPAPRRRPRTGDTTRRSGPAMAGPGSARP
ncbi:hypothetical protein [Streptomyces endocoffeicus]|uniref:hypothetical protein n=1 Tax=Streptomyces endocoffeicus TaxID=2898945 RepID=UPI001E53072A|nr:hypothetical protein [Streptomyces endocoffeicus]